MYKVYIVYHHIAHYREPIFRELMEDENVEYTILADNKPHMEAISVVTPDQHPDWKWKIIPTRKIKLFGKEVIWQGKTVLACLFDKVDAVIFLGDPRFASNWIATLICKLRHIRTLQWGMALRRPESGIKWLVRKLYLKLFEGHLLYGQWAYNWLLKHGFDSAHLWVVYNSLDFNTIESIRHNIDPYDILQKRLSLKVGNNMPLLFHSGRLGKRKKILLLLDAIHVLKTRGREIHLVLVGDGPEAIKLKKEAISKNIQNQVHFLGARYDEKELGLLMCASDLAVSAGDIGLFAIHAFSYGLPILTHNNKSWTHGPEFEAVVPGKTGIYFDENNTSDLADKIEHTLFGENSLSSMSQQCIQLVRTRYNPSYQKTIFFNALQQLLKGQKCSS